METRRHRGSHILQTTDSQMALRLSALRCAGRQLPPWRFLVPVSVKRLSRSQAPNAAGRIRSIEKSNELVGNRTRDFPSCRMEPKRNTLQLLPLSIFTRRGYTSHQRPLEELQPYKQNNPVRKSGMAKFPILPRKWGLVNPSRSEVLRSVSNDAIKSIVLRWQYTLSI
jgi:hypothetical protein